MKQPKEIIEQAEAEVREKIAGALMDFFRSTGLQPWRVEIHPVFGERELEGFDVTVRSNRNGI